MVVQRDTRTSEVNGRVIKTYEPTDGQIAILAQAIKVGKRKDAAPGTQFAAIGNIMNVLDRLVVDDDDRDFLADLLVDGDLDIPELIAVVLGGDDTIGGEVADAAPATIVKRRPAIKRG